MKNKPGKEILLGLLRAEPVIGTTPEQWRAVTLLARQHRVSSLLFWRLKTLGITGQVPPDLLQELYSASLETAARNLRIYHELSGLFERFQHDKIEGVLLKGAYLAEEVYGNVAIRPMDDVDLLVKKSDLGRVGEIMQVLDFTPLLPSRVPAKEFHHFGFTHNSNGLDVEVHWDLIDPTHNIHVDLDGLWERTQATLVAGIPVRAMTPEDQILHLCVHASVHVFEYGLSAMCDLNETLRHFLNKIDWECLRQRAYSWNAERCLYVNMRLAKELLHAPVTDDWLNTIQPADFELRFLTIARKHLFASVERTGINLNSWSNLVEFWKADNLPHKISFLWQRLFPSRQSMALKYGVPPGSLRIFLFYPVRLKDLLKENSRVAWRLLRREEQLLSQADQQNQVNRLRSWLISGKAS